MLAARGEYEPAIEKHWGRFASTFEMVGMSLTVSGIAMAATATADASAGTLDHC